MAELQRKQKFAKGIKAEITNQFNFVNIDNPFANSDFTLQNLKEKRHKEFLIKSKERKDQIKQQMRDLEKKIEIYQKFNDE